MRLRRLSQLTIAIVVVAGFTTTAFAGPPMICHAIEIGGARTLPWVDLNYHKSNSAYDVKNLTPDTLAILDASAPVLVRMETLRRATIYARQDPQVAKELIMRLQARAAESDAGALAAFDFGYAIASYQQWMGKDEPNAARGLDGYAWVKRALRMRGSDAEMEFAAALVTLNGAQEEHRDHVQRAMAGAKGDALLAENLRATFRNESVSALLMKTPAE